MYSVKISQINELGKFKKMVFNSFIDTYSLQANRFLFRIKELSFLSRYFTKFLLKKQVLFLTLKDTNATRGCLILSLDKDVGYLNRVLISSELRGKGLGNLLITETIKVAKNENTKFLRCDVLSDNVAALHLYQNFGFRKKSFCYVITFNKEFEKELKKRFKNVSRKRNYKNISKNVLGIFLGIKSYYFYSSAGPIHCSILNDKILLVLEDSRKVEDVKEISDVMHLSSNVEKYYRLVLSL
jgi:GNAT superfamily N-acetyltransferase